MITRDHLRWLLLAICLMVSVPVAAEIENFRGKRSRAPLFNVLQAAEAEQPIRFGIAVWGCARLPSAPTVLTGGYGAGLEFSYVPHANLGLTLAASFWEYDAEYDADNSDDDYLYVQAIDLEAGFRVFPVHWSGGSMYLEPRAVFMIADGKGLANRTYSVGGGIYFGVEFGWPFLRLYLEGGWAVRGSVSPPNSGWIDVPGNNADVGLFFDLLRVGVRVYL